MSEQHTRASLSARLTVRKGYREGTTYRLDAFPALVGRGDDVDVKLQDDPADPTLSRRHMRISVSGGRLGVEDLSTNGTAVGDVLLAPQVVMPLEDVALVSLGPNFVLEIETLRPRAAPPVKAPPPPRPSVGAMIGLQVTTLGPFVARVEGREVEPTAWETRKPVVMLAYLAGQRGRLVPSQKLCDDLWPDTDGRQALQSAVSRVRRALRSGLPPMPDPVVFERGNYRLSPSWQVTCDAVELEDACAQRDWPRVRELYRGPFLEGQTEDWVLARRSQLERLYLEAMAALGGSLEPEPALALYREVLQHEPCWEGGPRGPDALPGHARAPR